jgi:hypothetical protein
VPWTVTVRDFPNALTVTNRLAMSGLVPAQATWVDIVKNASARASFASPFRSGVDAVFAVVCAEPVVVTTPLLPIVTFAGTMLPPVRPNAKLGAA